VFDFNLHYFLKYLPWAVTALKITIQVCLISMILAIIWGTIIALMRLSKFRALSLISYWYVTIIRSTPFLVHIYFIFFGLPSLGIILPAITVGVLALMINSGAYSAEIIRAGIESIPRTQFEAGRALGLSNIQILRKVILPQAFKKILPPLTGQLSILIKDSSLLSVMGVMELTKNARTIQNITFRPVESYVPSIVLYLVTILTLIRISNFIEKKWKWE
jgi:polar amino acid transport system permease protein